MIARKEEESEQEVEQVEENGEVEVKKRKVVVPGEVIVSGEDYLPGDGTSRRGKDIVAFKYGLADESGRLVRVIPLSGVYIPRRGNVVIGRVMDITFNGWIMDINAPYNSFLSLSECPRFFNKNDLAEYFDIGDMIICKVWSIKHRGIDLTIKSKGLEKLEDGMIIYINSNKVPRVIGKEGSMIKIIKDETKCDIIVGQNGVVWIKGEKVDDELFAKEAISFVTEKSYVEGLTEKLQEWFVKRKK